MSTTLHGARRGLRLAPFSEPLPLHASAPGDGARRLLARWLRAASAALARHARQVDRPLQARRRRGDAATGLLEFYAEAGAPEGALYVDGRLVGHLDVRRL